MSDYQTSTNPTTRILTPCPPRKGCRVCDARLNGVFGSANKYDKYLHQAVDNGQQARGWVAVGHADRAYASARRAATFALMAMAAFAPTAKTA